MRKWLAICTAGLAGVVAAYAALGYLAVAPLARHYLPRWVETEWHSRLELGAIDIDPFALSLRAQSLRLTRPDGAPLASLEHLLVDLEWRSLLRAAWVLGEVQASGLQVQFQRDAQGRSNWDDVLQAMAARPGPATPAAGQAPRVRIEHLRVENGALEMAQAAGAAGTGSAQGAAGVAAASERRMKLALRLLEGQALSTWQDTPGRLTLEAGVAGQEATLRWSGSVNAARQAAQGEIDLRGLHMAPLIAWAGPLPAPLTAADGILDLRSETRMNWSKGGASGAPVLVLPEARASLSQARANLDVAQAGRGAIQWAASSVEARIENASLGGAASPHLQVQSLGLDFRGMTLALPARGSNLGARLEHLELSMGLEHQEGRSHLTDLQADLQDLTLQDSNRLGGADRPALARLARGSLRGAWAHSETRTLRADSLMLSGLQARVVRSAEGGALNWQTAMAGALTDLTPPGPRAPAPSGQRPDAHQRDRQDWQVRLGQLVVDNARLEAQDLSLTTPAMLEIRGARIVMDDLSNDLARPVPLQARLPLARGGVIEAKGRLTPQPGRADLQLRLAGVDLRPLSPYLSQVAFLQLEGGLLDASGRLQLSLGEPARGSFGGTASVRQLALADTSQPGAPVPFLSWQALTAPSLRMDLPGPRVRLQALRLVRPVGKFIIHEDGSLNVAHLVRPAASAKAASNSPATESPAAGTARVPPPTVTAHAGPRHAASPAPGAPGPSILVERLSVDSASLQFADLTLRPPFGAQIDALSGVINGLSDDPATTAQVELDGRVEDYGSAQIRGAVQPFRASEYTDLRLAFRNLDMTDLTPYAGKFAGRRIESGRLSADLQYRVSERRLAGQNKFVMRQLKLGERIDSPTALSLPLDLAIAVLEDSDGVIDLDIPVTGSLDDPDFSYGRIVWKAIANVLTRVVTAPFRALGHLLGGRQGEDLHGIAFEAGSALLPPPSQERLAAIAQVLARRPALRLTIVPAFDPMLDTKALQEQAMRRAVLEDAGIRLAPGEAPGPLDLFNPRVQSAIERQLRQRQGAGGGFKMLDHLRDAIRQPRPGDAARLAPLLEQLRPTFTVNPAQLRDLALARAQAMRDDLTGVGRLPPGRVEIREAPTTLSPPGQEATLVSVPMELSAAGGGTAPAR